MQYSSLSEKLAEKYDATLTLCILQSLLTNCHELVEAMRESQKEFWSKPVHEVPIKLGIKRSYVKDNTFSSDPSEFTYFEFIGHLRNAVSHPTSSEKKPYLPSTGYTTIPDHKDTISLFRFIDSPWVIRGKRRKGQGSDRTKLEAIAKDFKEEYKNCGELGLREISTGRFEIFRGHEDETFLPVFEAEIPLNDLKKLAEELANYLAQPTQDDWDGKSIKRLVA